ncbi:MAG: GCN5-related N-acetyltransferase [Pseudomonadota bacterium]
MTTPDLFGEDPDRALRAGWRDLVERCLPEAAAHRPDWPVHLDHCFARILLDAVHHRPWREVVRPPAWANTDAARLAEAIRLGEAVLAGEADLVALNDRSLALRGKGTPPERPR